MTFVDKKERSWNLSINVGVLQDIYDTCKIDFDELINNQEELTRVLFTKGRKIVELLAVVCQDQIKERQLSPRDFASIFDAETLEKATDAFTGALLSFYPRAKVGKALREKLPTVLEELDRKSLTKFESDLAKALSNNATN